MAATTPALDLPLFPLANVLFPGGHLPLRIFEPRYIDLVRECARTGRGFGVCLILEGREAGQPAIPAAVGTLATITDFHTREDGLLGIDAIAENYWHIHRQPRSAWISRRTEPSSMWRTASTTPSL